MTVAKLREALKEKGLDTSGLKAALVERLQEALRVGWGCARRRLSPAPSPKKSQEAEARGEPREGGASCRAGAGS